MIPKVHKSPLQWRPIVSCSTMITAGLGKVLVDILQRELSGIFRGNTILRDSTDLRH